jgi:cell wall-associated NlpC family hydrolase
MFSTFKNIDMTLPRSSYEMAKYGDKIDRSAAKKGDLIFFATFGGGRISHVGMITEVLEKAIPLK